MWKICLFCLVVMQGWQSGGAAVTLLATPANTTVEVGGTALLSAIVSGQGVGVWKKDNDYVNTNDPHYLVEGEKNLTIFNVSISDEGWYLIDYGASAQASAYLTVVDLPTNVTVYWSSSPQDGSTANLTCHVNHSHPSPSLSWYRNGVALTSATVYTQETNDSTGYVEAYSTLEVAVRAADAGAEYKCSVDFPQWTSALTANISLVLSSIAYDLQPSNTSVLLGSDVTLPCTVTGRNNDEPVTWYKDSHALAVDGSKYQQQSLFNLTLANASRDDAGLYSCDVSTLTAQAYLTVVDLPTAVSLHWESSYRAGSTVNMTCTCTHSYPLPSLSWYRNDQLLTSLTTFTSQSSDSSGYGDVSSTLEVTVTSQDEGARFTCSVDFPGWSGALTSTLTAYPNGASQAGAGVLGLVLGMVLLLLQH